MAHSKHSEYTEAGRKVASRNTSHTSTADLERGHLTRLIKKAVGPENADELYLELIEAKKFADLLVEERGLTNDDLIDADMSTILEICAEARKPGTAYIKATTIKAAIVYAALRPKRIHGVIQHNAYDETVVSELLNVIDGLGPAQRYKKIRPPFSEAEREEIGFRIRNTLKASEINLGGQMGHNILGDSGGTKPQPELERMAAFRLMIMQLVEDPEVMFIRGAQKISDLRKLVKKFEESHSKDLKHEIDYQAALIEHIYIPLLIAYGYSSLAAILAEQQDRMINPEEHNQTWTKIIDTAKKAAPANLREFVQDHQSATGIVIKSLIYDVASVLDAGGFTNYEIDGGVKGTHSTKKKIKVKGEAKTKDDMLRIRIIFDTGVDEKAIRAEFAQTVLDPELLNACVLETIWKQEGEAIAALYAHLDAIAKQGTIFGHNPDEIAFREQAARIRQQKRKHEKDKSVIVEEPMEYNGRFDNYYRNPKPNGYRAMQVIFIRNEALFECQIVGKLTHKNNTSGTASHLAYKIGELPKHPSENAKFTVSVFDYTNRIHELSRPATAADFLGSIDPDLAFSASSIIVDRINHIYDPSLGTPEPMLETRLWPGDRIMYGVDLSLLKNCAHRQDVIKACRVPEIKKRLIERDAEIGRKPDAATKGRLQFLLKKRLRTNRHPL